jgi:hypothetical protein
MNPLLRAFAGLSVFALLGCTAAVATSPVPETQGGPTHDAAGEIGAPLAEKVRAATERFRKVEAAEAAGYGLFHGCVSGPGGAMGVHFVNGDLVGDGEVDATRPEALMYEWSGGRFRLVGVEYVVLADAWNAGHAAPPVLDGQLFTFTGAPNRYGIPAFYALHVWAWQNNPDGVFQDFNRKVSCAEFEGTAAAH